MNTGVDKELPPFQQEMCTCARCRRDAPRELCSAQIHEKIKYATT